MDEQLSASAAGGSVHPQETVVIAGLGLGWVG